MALCMNSRLFQMFRRDSDRLSFLLTYKVRELVRFNCSENKNETRTEEVETDERLSGKLSGFAQAFDKFQKLDEPPKKIRNVQKFSTLLRNSKFIDLGDPEGKVVHGEIYHTVGDDLYIDFGWKFHCVCVRPAKNGHEYVRGAKVRLRIKELELSTRFLGSDKDLTLNEADCVLLGLTYSPVRQTTDNSKS